MVLWWPNTLPAPGDPLLAGAGRILIDTRAVGERADLFIAVERLARRLPMADLSWSRLQPWRATLAALFEGPTCRPFLDHVKEVQVSGSFGARHLMGGWLMDRLGLTRDQVQVGDARHVRVRVYAELDGCEARFGVERHSDERVLSASIEIDDGPHRIDIVPLPPQWASRSLIGPLRHTGPDPVYAGALRGAVELLHGADAPPR
jgi:glucose-6-phosphate dehydrogenase assembly protein OpcA